MRSGVILNACHIDIKSTKDQCNDWRDPAKECAKILNGEAVSNTLTMWHGALVLFRGRNSIHRVTPTEGNTCLLYTSDAADE